MAPAYLIALQAVAPALAGPAGGQPGPGSLPAIDFNLAQAPRQRGCGGPLADEILVCGRRPEPVVHRLGPALPDASRELPRAEMRLFGNATGRAYVESAPVDRGAVANRVMFGVRLPF